MGYRFKRDESVPEGVRRIAGEELESVVAQLRHAQGSKRDEAIHESRKGVKKVRALLRLVKAELGDAYRVESRVLRQAGRALSDLRDANSVIEILDKLQEKYSGKLPRAAVDPIRRELLARKKQAEERAGVSATLREIAGTLAAAGKRLKTWPISTHGFPALEGGLEKTMETGRTAFLRARKHPDPENYHEWRKRLKDHWYHVRLLEDVWTEWMQGYETSLKNVETWLGDDHNLVILRQHLIRGVHAAAAEKSTERILRLIDKYQKELRDNAESLGKRIHGEKPRRFAKRVQHLWDEWQAEPGSLEDFEKAIRNSRTAA